MNKNTFLLSAFLGLSVSASALEKQLYSPDGKLLVTVSDEQGLPSYQISYDGTAFLLDSPLGLDTDIGDFTKRMEMTEATLSYVNDEYDLSTIKQNRPQYQANVQTYTFSQDGKKIYDVIFQVSDHDVAFKYQLYPQGDIQCCVIRREATGFVLPEGTTTFLCPQSKPMGGFARTSPSYETPYTTDDTPGKNGWGEGYTFPCLFRRGDKGWILISETGTDGRYCGCHVGVGCRCVRSAAPNAVGRRCRQP